MTTIYVEENHSIKLKPGRKAWGVDVPAYVYDLWMPLIGSDIISFYAVLWRLARDGRTFGLTLKKLARKMRKGDKTIAAFAETLKNLEFIEVKTPNEDERRQGYTTIFTVLDPPAYITQEQMEYFDPKNEYEPLCPWLVEEIEAQASDDDSDMDALALIDDSDEQAQASIDDLIDPSSIGPSSNTSYSPPVGGDDIPLPERRIRRTFEDYSLKEETETKPASSKQWSLLEAYLISQVHGAKSVADTYVKNLNMPLYAYDPLKKEQVQLPSANELYRTDSMYKRWIVEVKQAQGKTFNWNMKAWSGAVCNAKDYLEWRSKQPRSSANYVPPANNRLNMTVDPSILNDLGDDDE